MTTTTTQLIIHIMTSLQYEKPQLVRLQFVTIHEIQSNSDDTIIFIHVVQPPLSDFKIEVSNIYRLRLRS